MEKKADAEIDRHPRQVKQRGRATPGEKAADLIEISQRLEAVAIAAGLQWKTNERIKYASPKPFIKVAADTYADPASDQVQPALEQIKRRCQRHQRHQRRDAASWQHAIVNLQHEK